LDPDNRPKRIGSLRITGDPIPLGPTLGPKVNGSVLGPNSLGSVVRTH
jgi:hypothetical protein